MVADLRLGTEQCGVSSICASSVRSRLREHQIGCPSCYSELNNVDAFQRSKIRENPQYRMVVNPVWSPWGAQSPYANPRKKKGKELRDGGGVHKQVAPNHLVSTIGEIPPPMGVMSVKELQEYLRVSTL